MIELPKEETERRWRITTRSGRSHMHAVLYGVTRDQLTGTSQITFRWPTLRTRRVRISHCTTSSAFRDMGIAVGLCGTDHGL